MINQNLWDFFTAVLDNNWNAGARTLVFLACLTQVYATFVSGPDQLCNNPLMGAGHQYQLELYPCVSVFPSKAYGPLTQCRGCDLAGLFPRYFTIVRGQILCSLLAIAVGE